MTDVTTDTPQVATPPPPPPEPKIEEIVTPDILDAIIKNNNRPDLEFVDFDAKAATKAGDNYMSLIYSVTINFKTKTGEKEVLPVILKVLPRNEIRIKMITDANIFVRDVNMYDKVLPALERFQREVVGLSKDEIYTPWPKCFACKTDGKNDYIAMEDLKVQGFRMANRKVGLDFDHCEVVMKAMARFHALSYGLYQGDFDKIVQDYPYLEEFAFSEEKQPEIFKEMFKNAFDQMAEMLRGTGEERGADLVSKIFDDSYMGRMHQLVGAKVRWAVINHGDCWTNNFLFRYNEETNKPVDVKFVDFQVSKAASRTVDIHYFLHSSPQNHVLNEREKEIEDIYFEAFTKCAKKLGVDLDAQELTKENFEKELEKFRYFGVVTGLWLAMVTQADASDVPDMEAVTEEDITNKDAAKNFFFAMLKERALEKIKNLAVNHLPRLAEMAEHL